MIILHFQLNMSWTLILEGQKSQMWLEKIVTCFKHCFEHFLSLFLPKPKAFYFRYIFINDFVMTFILCLYTVIFYWMFFNKVLFPSLTITKRFDWQINSCLKMCIIVSRLSQTLEVNGLRRIIKSLYCYSTCEEMLNFFCSAFNLSG